MKNREEIINSIEDAWVLQEILYEQEDAFNNDNLFDKTLEVIGAFADIIYEIVGVEEEERDEIQDRAYKKGIRIKNIIRKTE
jgi:hypothetical protein